MDNWHSVQCLRFSTQGKAAIASVKVMMSNWRHSVNGKSKHHELEVSPCLGPRPLQVYINFPIKGFRQSCRTMQWQARTVPASNESAEGPLMWKHKGLPSAWWCCAIFVPFHRTDPESSLAGKISFFTLSTGVPSMQSTRTWKPFIHFICESRQKNMHIVHQHGTKWYPNRKVVMILEHWFKSTLFLFCIFSVTSLTDKIKSDVNT